MKRFLLLITSLALVSSSLFAAPRSEQQAMEAASQYFTSHSHILRAPAKDGRLALRWTATQSNGAPAFYVFNRGENDGFVIVSAEDRTYTILAYGDNGHFDEQNMPENLRSWLEGYTRTIEQVAAMPENPSARLHAPRRKPAKAAKKYTPVSPICTTQWNQGEPYNNMCPEDAGGRSVTGCVATAAAQVMKAYNYPTQGIGSHSYDWEDKDGNVTTLTADFGATTYDWAHMIDNYQATSSTTTQKNAVATLMHHCGVACNMGYSSSGSGANSNTMISSLITYFGYDAGIRTLLLDYMTEETFVDAIAEDLLQGHPVFFSGRTIANEGHAFVGDGIDADGLVHINWGWGGSCDDYFRVSLLDPENQGTGGSSGNYAFTEGVTAFIGIQPDKGGTPSYTLTGNNLQFGSLKFSRNDNMYFKIDTFLNVSATRWEGKFGYQLYQNGQFYDTQLINELIQFNPGWGWLYIDMYDDLSGLQDGIYEFVPIITTDDQNNTTPVMIKGYGAYRCKIKVSGDQITITLPGAPEDPDPEEPTIDPTSYDFVYLDAYYTGSANNGHTWDLQLATKDFYGEEASNQLCMILRIETAHENSFLGSYLTTESGIHACKDITVYEGNQSSYSRWTTQDGQCTVIYDETSKQFVVHYSVVIGKKLYVGEVVLPAGSVGAFVDDGSSFPAMDIDKTLYTAFSPSEAIRIVYAQTENEDSTIPYAIAGQISEVVNTPEQIKQYGNCRLYLADEQSAIYSYNTRWLGNTAFTDGDEIEENGEGVIVGKVQNYQGTPEINSGYFCLYRAPEKPLEPIAEDEDDDDFIENFDLYRKDLKYINYGVAFIDAQKAIDNYTRAVIRLQFFVAQDATDITAGKYTISTTTAPGTVLSAYNDSYVLGSWAANMDSEDETIYDIWYIERGKVTVAQDGSVRVDATNSKGVTVKCNLLQLDTEAIDNVQRDDVPCTKVLRDGHLYIIRNGVVYSLSGSIVND